MPTALAPLVGKSEYAVATDASTARASTPCSPPRSRRSAAQQISDLNLIGIYTQPTTERRVPRSHDRREHHRHGALRRLRRSRHRGASTTACWPARTAASPTASTTPATSTRAAARCRCRPATAARSSSPSTRACSSPRSSISTRRCASPARAGAEMVVLDAHTAQVLAMASSGTYDASNPNTIEQHRADEPAGDVGLRAGFGAEVDHVRGGDPGRRDQAEHGDLGARPDHDGRHDGERRLVPPDRAVHRDRHPRRVVQRRHAEDRAAARPEGVGPLRAALRRRPQDRHRTARRERRLPAADVAVVGFHLREPAVRAGREHDRAAARLDLPDLRQRRRAGRAAHRPVGHRAGRHHDARPGSPRASGSSPRRPRRR